MKWSGGWPGGIILFCHRKDTLVSWRLPAAFIDFSVCLLNRSEITIKGGLLRPDFFLTNGIDCVVALIFVSKKSVQ